MRGILFGFKTNKYTLIITSILSLTFFVWYYTFSYYALGFIASGDGQKFFLYNASFNFLASFTTVACSSFIRKVPGIRLWCISTLFGAVFLMFFHETILGLAIYLSLGPIFGICLLNFFTFFGDLTTPEERGRVAGLIVFFYLLFSSVILAFVRTQSFHIIMAFCVFLSIITLMIELKYLNKRVEFIKKVSVKLKKRTLVLYLIPWIIFSLINGTTAKTVSFHVLKSIIPLFLILQVVVGAIGAIVGGLISDFIGRKTPLAFALTLFGISSAISAFVKVSLLANFIYISTGLTWGILSTLYLFVVWGDLADNETYPYTYSLGLATFFIAMGIGALLTSEILKISLFTASITNCLVIFVSNISLILAPEILPSDFLEKTRLRFYIYLVKRRKHS